VNLKQFAHKEYKGYCLAEGSQHIVSEFALYNILKLIRKYKPTFILEVGVGIGTISGSILKCSRKTKWDVTCFGTESNQFCLDQIPHNLKKDAVNLLLYNEVSSLPDYSKFDLIIVDGAESKLEKVKNKISHRGIILIEGDRSDQVAIIRELFPNSRVAQLISTDRNGKYSVKRAGDYQGGLKILFTNPNLRQLTHWGLQKVKRKLNF
jgi:hypothetical protein